MAEMEGSANQFGRVNYDQIILYLFASRHQDLKEIVACFSNE